MIPIFIDTQQLSEQFDFTQDEINAMLDFTAKEITARFAQEWENEANAALKSSRQEYITNIVVVDEGFAKGAVVLTGQLPNMIESGVDSFDMKGGFLNGPNAKQGKNGRYNTIPFRFGTPGSLAENFTGGILPQEVYDILRSKPQVQNIPGGGVSSRPLKEEEVPQRFREPQKKIVQSPKSKSFEEYQHKKSIYVGIRRVRDSVTGQNTYQSFRRVSEVSDPNSWIHPGIEERDLAGKTLARFDIPSEAGRAFDIWFDRRG